MIYFIVQTSCILIFKEKKILNNTPDQTPDNSTPILSKPPLINDQIDPISPSNPVNPSFGPGHPPFGPGHPPFGPGHPLFPNHPFRPNSPLNPLNPFDPFSPLNPNSPLNPHSPLNPNNSSNPNSPFHPSSYLRPNSPLNPSNPNSPLNSAHPMNPMNPLSPLHPNNIGQKLLTGRERPSDPFARPHLPQHPILPPIEFIKDRLKQQDPEKESQIPSLHPQHQLPTFPPMFGIIKISANSNNMPTLTHNDFPPKPNDTSLSPDEQKHLVNVLHFGIKTMNQNIIDNNNRDRQNTENQKRKNTITLSLNFPRLRGPLRTQTIRDRIRDAIDRWRFKLKQGIAAAKARDDPRDELSF